MPETLSINEFAAKVKERRPDLANIPDGTLVGKMLAAAPELKNVVRMEYSDKRGGAYESPRYTGTGATAGQVAQDQAAEVLRGVPEAITGIPAALGAVGKTAWHALSGRTTETAKDLSGMASGIAAPFITAGKGAIELASPGTVNAPAPESPEWSQSARTGGAMLAGAELPNALSGVAKAASPLVSRLKGITPDMSTITSSPELNKWMNVTPKAMEHGANPAQQILGDKLLATTKEATQANVKTALKATGNEMEQSLLDATLQGAPPLDATPIVDNALQSVTKKIGTPKDATFQSTLTGIKSDIVGSHPNLSALTPKQAQSLISHLGDSINWHTVTENPINDAMIDIYRDLRKAQISTQVPALEPILSKWQNLYVGDKALSGSILKDAAGTGTGKSLLWNKFKGAAKKAAIVGGAAYTANKIIDAID